MSERRWQLQDRSDLIVHTQYRSIDCIAEMTTIPATSSNSSNASDASDSYLWDVQEILAERTSILGDPEYLVVWKTSWIPKSGMMADGPILRKFEATRKCEFTIGKNVMQMFLPVEPGSTLAADCDEIDYRAHSKRSARHLAAAPSSTSSQQQRQDVSANAEPPTKKNQQENSTTEPAKGTDSSP